MIADLVIKIVEKLFNSAMEQRDEEKIKLFEQNKMLMNRARLTSSDELIVSFIERRAPLQFDKLVENFGHIDCLAKRVAMLGAYGFVKVNNDIIDLEEDYREIAAVIIANSTDQTIVLKRPEE